LREQDGVFAARREFVGGEVTSQRGLHAQHSEQVIGANLGGQFDRLAIARQVGAEIGEGGPSKMMVAAGRLKEFRACCASVKRLAKKGICIDREAAALLEVEVGDTLVMVPR